MHLTENVRKIGPHPAQRTEFEARAEIALKRAQKILVILRPTFECPNCVTECDEAIAQIDAALVLAPRGQS